MSGSALYTQDFGNWQILMAFVLVIISMLISKKLTLKLETDFFIASIRTIVQLLSVGYLLRWILKTDSIFVNLFILLIMSLVAAHAITSRLKVKSFKIFIVSLISLVLSVWILGLVVLSVFFNHHALSQAVFFIPFMGVLMGNALTAISLTFIALERIRAENLLEIETFKALGANSFEACQRLYRDLLRSSLNPILNGMTVVGIVSLPGIMSGQLIGGVDPLVAARFQILIMFLILLTAMLGSLIAICASHYAFMPRWLLDSEVKLMFPSVMGDKLALSGPSGVGKSRLLKSMSNLDGATMSANLKEYFKLNVIDQNLFKVHYLHQRCFFIPGSVEENLRFPYLFQSNSNEIYDAIWAQKMFEKLGLSKELLEKNALTLSGGEGQLVHFIRGIMLNPQILFLDEPFSSLDSNKIVLLESFLNEWVQKEDRRFVLISHDQEQINRLATKVLFFER